MPQSPTLALSAIHSEQQQKREFRKFHAKNNFEHTVESFLSSIKVCIFDFHNIYLVLDIYITLYMNTC